MSQQMQMHRSSVHRMLVTLAAEGFVEKNDLTEKYRLGMYIMQTGFACLERFELRSEARQHMKEFRRLTEETNDLSIFVDYEVLFIEHLESPQEVNIAASPGRRIPAHCTSPGKVFLAYMDPRERKKYLEKPLTRYTENTVVDPAELEAHLATVREKGIAFDIKEHWEEVVSCAVPVRDHRGEVVAALSVPGPASRLLPELEGELPQLLKETAAKISERIGYQPAIR
ncbi:MAG: IclR family transcriptional regulator [Peptococcaceae bacterium]|nr:IclR family transcriptional regulator [Peptococcaceae bacterium]